MMQPQRFIINLTTILLVMLRNRFYFFLILFNSCISVNTQKENHYSYTIVNHSLKSILKDVVTSDTGNLFIGKNTIKITTDDLAIKKIYNCIEKSSYKGYIYFEGMHLFLHGNLENSLAKRLIKRTGFLKKDILYRDCDDYLIPTIDYESFYFELDTLSNKLIPLMALE